MLVLTGKKQTKQTKKHENPPENVEFWVGGKSIVSTVLYAIIRCISVYL
ncbi:Uncharacterized protein APZ42_016829 [Daphnia magna]|uniref:Uncharacterized protein n=1 Tax=Daphnia magna TaxID=35525 RepID=A0A165A6Q6_9CRUS|nr:Uncharacterized protein APZ42_016829 [Daphnia magna]